MIQVFSRERLSEYIVETEKFVLPLLKEVRRTWPEYGNLTHLVKIQMVPMLESAKLLLLMSGEYKGRGKFAGVYAGGCKMEGSIWSVF